MDAEQKLRELLEVLAVETVEKAIERLQSDDVCAADLNACNAILKRYGMGALAPEGGEAEKLRKEAEKFGLRWKGKPIQEVDLERDDAATG